MTNPLDEFTHGSPPKILGRGRALQETVRHIGDIQTGGEVQMLFAQGSERLFHHFGEGSILIVFLDKL